MTPHADLVARLRSIARDYRNDTLNMGDESVPEITWGELDDIGAVAQEAADALASLPPPAAPRTCACGPSDVCRDDGCQCACHAAAPPADLVALVREWQEAVKDEACYLCGPEPESPARVFDINERKRAAKNGILAYPLPAAPSVPDTPQIHGAMEKGRDNAPTPRLPLSDRSKLRPNKASHTS